MDMIEHHLVRHQFRSIQSLQLRFIKSARMMVLPASGSPSCQCVSGGPCVKPGLPESQTSTFLPLRPKDMI